MMVISLITHLLPHFPLHMFEVQEASLLHSMAEPAKLSYKDFLNLEMYEKFRENVLTQIIVIISNHEQLT